MATTMYSKERFKQLILYIAKMSADDARFGATKLNKLLFFSDFLAFGHLGEPISGATYQKLKWGPAPRQLLPVQREMADEGTALVKRQGTFSPDRTVPLVDPDLEQFSAAELGVINEVLTALRDDTASMVSDRSHQFSLGWQLADEQEDIPYETVFLYSGDAHPMAVEYGRELALSEGWVTVPA